MDFTLIETILGRSRVSQMNHGFEIVKKAAQSPLKIQNILPAGTTL
jgi:hypothetical protein